MQAAPIEMDLRGEELDQPAVPPPSPDAKEPAMNLLPPPAADKIQMDMLPLPHNLEQPANLDLRGEELDQPAFPPPSPDAKEPAMNLLPPPAADETQMDLLPLPHKLEQPANLHAIMDLPPPLEEPAIRNSPRAEDCIIPPPQEWDVTLIPDCKKAGRISNEYSKTSTGKGKGSSKGSGMNKISHLPSCSATTARKSLWPSLPSAAPCTINNKQASMKCTTEKFDKLSLEGLPEPVEQCLEPVFCICRKPSNGRMVGCDGPCEEWYHFHV